MAAKRRRKPQSRVTLASLPQEWDTGPREQHRRPHQITERGETDPETGKVRNPNSVRGIKYRSEVERLAEMGILSREHVTAANNWAELSHRMFGSPAQRSCLDTDPIGHDKPGAPPIVVEQYRELCCRLGVFQRATLDRVCYHLDPCPPSRRELLRNGLDIIAEFYSRKKGA